MNTLTPSQIEILARFDGGWKFDKVNERFTKLEETGYNSTTYDLGTALEIGQEESIPVSALEELFSKSGEQLARHYAVAMGFKLELASGGDVMRSFMEAYNLQEVKIASSMLNIDSLLSEFKRQGFNVDNWDGEQGAEKAIVDGVSVIVAELKKERDAYYDQLHAKRIEVEELKSQLYR